MKINMSSGGTAKWFAVTVASSDKSQLSDKGSKFNQLVDHPDWNPDNIDFKIVMNGIEFENLDDIFRRLDEHIEKEAQEKAEQNPLLLAKLYAIQGIINAQSVEEITGEWE
jgi:hypothetical protein